MRYIEMQTGYLYREDNGDLTGDQTAGGAPERYYLLVSEVNEECDKIGDEPLLDIDVATGDEEQINQVIDFIREMLPNVTVFEDHYV